MELDLPDAEPTTHFRINQNYADKYKTTKRRQELTGYRAQALLREGEEGFTSSSSSESEDSDAEELTPEMEVNIFKTIQMIKNKDPQIYDKDKKWFAAKNATQKDKPSVKKEPVKFYKDYMRERLQKAVERGYASEEGSDVEDESQQGYAPISSSSSSSSSSTTNAPSYFEEQANLKNAFKQSIEGNQGGDDDDDFLVKKERNQEELDHEEQEATALRNQMAARLPKNEQEALKNYFEATPESESEKFLRDYVMNREWADHNEGDALPRMQHNGAKESAGTTGIDRVDEDDLKDEVADRFERAYNFRFEEPTQVGGVGGSMERNSSASNHITTYSRNTQGSLRRKDDRRKDKREERRLRKAVEKKKKREELKRLKNLKREEMQERMSTMDEEGGMKGMQELLAKAGMTAADLEGEFDSDKFDAKMKAMFDDDYYEEEQQQEAAKYAEINEKNERSMDHMDYEDIVGGMKTRFKYRNVEATSFGLSTEEILTASDNILGQFVSVKKLAPYREQEWVVSARERRQFRQNMFREDEEGNRLRKIKNEEYVEEGDTVDDKNVKEYMAQLAESSSSSSSSSKGDEEAPVVAPAVPKQKKKRLRKKQAVRAAKQGRDLEEVRAELMEAERVAAAAAAAALPMKRTKLVKVKKKRGKKRKSAEENISQEEMASKRLASYGEDVVVASKKRKHKKKKKNKE